MRCGWFLFPALVLVACGPQQGSYSGVLTRTETCSGAAPVSESFGDSVVVTPTKTGWALSDGVCPEMQVSSDTAAASVATTTCSPTTMFGIQATATFTSGTWTISSADELDVDMDGTMTFTDASGNPETCEVNVQGPLYSDASTVDPYDPYIY